MENFTDDSQPTTPRKRKQVKNACGKYKLKAVNCQKACKKCDDARPCTRCSKYGIADTCEDSVRKERKKGVKRGPYKRKQSQEYNERSIAPAYPSYQQPKYNQSYYSDEDAYSEPKKLGVLANLCSAVLDHSRAPSPSAETSVIETLSQPIKTDRSRSVSEDFQKSYYAVTPPSSTGHFSLPQTPVKNGFDPSKAIPTPEKVFF